MTLSSKNDKTCLKIDCRDIILNGHGKLKASADNEKEQLCYFNKKNPEDRTYNTFSSKKISHRNEILFEIDSVLSKTKKGALETFDANSELKELIENNGRIDVMRAVGRTNSQRDSKFNSKFKKLSRGITKPESARARFLHR